MIGFCSKKELYITPDGQYMTDANGDLLKFVTIQGAEWKKYTIEYPMLEGAGSIQLGLWASNRDGGVRPNICFDDVTLINKGQ